MNISISCDILRTALRIPPTQGRIAYIHEAPRLTIAAPVEYAIRKSSTHSVMLRRRANALGNSQGQVTRLRKSNVRTCSYGVSPSVPLA